MAKSTEKVDEAFGRPYPLSNHTPKHHRGARDGKRPSLYLVKGEVTPDSASSNDVDKKPRIARPLINFLTALADNVEKDVDILSRP